MPLLLSFVTRCFSRSASKARRCCSALKPDDDRDDKEDGRGFLQRCFFSHRVHGTGILTYMNG